MTPRAAGLGGTPNRVSGQSGAVRVPVSMSSHQQLQQALHGGGAEEAVKVRGSPSPPQNLGPAVPGGGRVGGRGNKVVEEGDEVEDDGYVEDEEGDDEEGELDDDEIMEEVQLPGMFGRMGRSSGGGKNGLGGSGFFGSMEMDIDHGEKTEEDPDVEAEEAPTTDTGDVGGSTTDDATRKRRDTAATETGIRKKAPPPSAPGKVTRSSARESDREKERKEKEARDKAKMPPPPPVMKRAQSTTTRGGVKLSAGAGGKEGTTSRVRAGSTANNTATTTTTGGLGRATSVRRGTVSKEEGGATGGVKLRSAVDAKAPAKPTSGTTAGTAATTRHMRTRSIVSGTAPSTTRQNGTSINPNATGTDSEDPTTKRPMARTGLTKKPRPASMFVPSTKSSTDRESDNPAQEPTITATTRPRQQTISKETVSVTRKPSTRAAAAPPHRRNQSEAQPAPPKPTRPEFTTLQKDYTAPPPAKPHPESTTTNATLLPDAPTLQKQTHLLQLLLLHNTAIQSFQAFHADAHTKLAKRYEATTELYQDVRGRLAANARAADMAVLRKILQATPAVPPTGGVARWGTAAGRRLSGSREHLARGDGRRKTLTGQMASPVEERIQVFSESVKRVEALLRKGGEVARVRGGFESWASARVDVEGGGGGEGRKQRRAEDGLPKQWHRDWATVKRKVEVAVDGIRDFWVAYQHVLTAPEDEGRLVAVGGEGGGGGGTLLRMVMGYLELGEDVVLELDEMKALEKVWVEEARERMRRVVREVMAGGEGLEGMDGMDGMEGVEGAGGVALGSGMGSGAWRM